MIVTTGASDCQTHERTGGHVDLLVNKIHLEFRRITVVEGFRANGEKARSHQTLVGWLFGKQIPRHLFADELVERLVLVERFHDVIPEPPGMGKRDVPFHAVALGITGHVQPVPSPAHPELGTRKQTVHHLLEGVRSIVFQKIPELLGGRRQSDEVKKHPAGQCRLVRIRSGLQALLLKACKDQVVNGRARPPPVLDFGFGLIQGLKGPKFLSLLNVDLILDHRLARPWVRRAHLDPSLQSLDHLIRKLLLWRHLQIFVPPMNRLHQQAFRRIPGHNRRTNVASLPHAELGIEQKTALGLTGLDRVAFVAMLCQSRANLLFEELDLGRISEPGQGQPDS